MGIRCEKSNCKFAKEVKDFSSTWHVCRYGAGYDYTGGDIIINKSLQCTCYKRKEVEK